MLVQVFHLSRNKSIEVKTSSAFSDVDNLGRRPQCQGCCFDFLVYCWLLLDCRPGTDLNSDFWPQCPIVKDSLASRLNTNFKDYCPIFSCWRVCLVSIGLFLQRFFVSQSCYSLSACLIEITTACFYLLFYLLVVVGLNFESGKRTKYI